MVKYILFSAVGTTDPICNHHDGAILHICRIYKPEQVYLFFSEEINELRKTDNRYFYSLRKLAEKLNGFDPEIHELIDEKLSEVHKFDAFYHTFEKYIAQIHEKYPDYTILLNLSSGTPAMKNALNLIAALNDETFQAIQVSSPNQSSNPKKDDIRKFDPPAAWESDEDNKDDFVNRTSLESNPNLIARIKKEIILKHIDVYDYQAAFTIAKEIEPQIKINGMKLLQAACCRLQLDEQEIDKNMSGTGIRIVPMSHGPERNLIEFLLWLQVKQERCDYADFIRGITPAAADMFEMILKEQTGIRLTDFCMVRRNGSRGSIYYIDRDYLERSEKGREYLEVFDRSGRIGGALKNGPYSSIHALVLMDEYYKGSNTGLIQIMENIRKAESRVRNLAAHEIVSITDDWIVEQCGFTPVDIIEMLKELAGFTGITLPVGIWDSYRSMNDLIKVNIMI